MAQRLWQRSKDTVQGGARRSTAGLVPCSAEMADHRGVTNGLLRKCAVSGKHGADPQARGGAGYREVVFVMMPPVVLETLVDHQEAWTGGRHELILLSGRSTLLYQVPGP